ncbi:hypothetical protein AB0945_38555 [Streptomyces sp. NPDC005474]|uniref:hypothetical protein n=1 Tax=Streptomyces sp. NPDC005474 TaxID=3154878 RepID=UPI0034514959
MGAVAEKTRRHSGLTSGTSRLAKASTKFMLPLIWLARQPRVERRMMRVMWGPDAVKLIESARELHCQAKEGRLTTASNQASV